jgi:hypothetical protein
MAETLLLRVRARAVQLLDNLIAQNETKIAVLEAKLRNINDAKALEKVINDLDIAERQLRYTQRAMVASSVSAAAAVLSAVAALVLLLLTISGVVGCNSLNLI